MQCLAINSVNNNNNDGQNNDKFDNWQCWKKYYNSPHPDIPSPLIFQKNNQINNLYKSIQVVLRALSVHRTQNRPSVFRSALIWRSAISWTTVLNCPSMLVIGFLNLHSMVWKDTGPVFLRMLVNRYQHCRHGIGKTAHFSWLTGLQACKLEAIIDSNNS